MKNSAAYIVYATRSPIGNLGGHLSPLRIDDLLAQLLSELKTNFEKKFPLEEIDDIIVGCANQAGEDNRNLARMSAVLAGLPFSIPAVTVNRLCGSSLEALLEATCRIWSNYHDCIVVGGAESMSRAPYVLSKAENAFDRQQKIFDTSLGWRFENPAMKKIIPLLTMGETAEEVAKRLNISREDQDQFAFQSHQKSLHSIRSNYFDDEITPIIFHRKKELITVNQDEGPRPSTSLEKLAQLPAAFKEEGTVTAGNSSTLNDGAAVLLVVSEAFLNRHQLRPMAKITGLGVAGIHPSIMGLGPVEAVNRLLKKYQKNLKQFSFFEINEAFAAQALGVIRQLDIDPNQVNLRGGAISLGHPLGCSGARIVTTLLHIMKNHPEKKEALASMCIGVGQGIAVSLESCF